MRILFIILMFGMLGSGCTDSFVSQIQGFSDTVKAKAAEASAAFESAKQTMGKIQAIYNILHPSSSVTPSVPPTADQPQPAVEGSISSQ